MSGVTTTAAYGAGGSLTAASVATAAAKGSRRLVLHFDINKTIVMKDSTANLNNATLTVRDCPRLWRFRQ